MMAFVQKLSRHLCRSHQLLLNGYKHTYCTASAESLSQSFRDATGIRLECRTQVTDPREHTMRQEGLFYTVSEDEASLYYSGAHPRYKQLWRGFNETAIMVRRPVVEISQFLQNTNYDLPVVRYVLYGTYGTGKSISMYHLMHICGKNDWIIAHVPWAADINRHFHGEVQPSAFKTGRIDLPYESANWLAYFKQLNGAKLKDLLLENKYIWTKRESSEVGSPLLEAIDFGLARPKYANDIVGLVVKEIKAQAVAKKFKLLFAVDGVNAFWQPTLIKREENRALKHDPEELTLVHNFKKLLSNDWSNGAVICSVDKVAQLDLDHNSSDLPRYLLGEDGFAHLDPFLPIQTEAYNEKEMQSALEYLIDRQYLQNPKAYTEEGKKELVFLSQNNPWVLLDITGMW